MSTMTLGEKMKRIEVIAKNQELKPNLDRLKDDKCTVCGSAKNLHLHHVKYSVLDVATLCASCHRYLHGYVALRNEGYV
jgi:hypothetical protein